MISPAQWAYALGLAGLFAWRGPSLVAWVLLADFLALLAIAGAMDFGLLDRTGANWSMLVVWVATAAAFAMQPGTGRVLAALSVAAITIFIACLYFRVQFATTSAIVNASAFIMLAVAGYGMGGDSGGSRRYSDRPLSVGLSAGNSGLGAGGMARGADLLSSDSGGR